MTRLVLAVVALSTLFSASAQCLVETSFTIERVESSPLRTGYYISLALGNDDAPHISCYRWGEAELVYALKRNGSWAQEVVDSDGGYYTSIVVDSEERPRILYHIPGQLRYAVKSDGLWTSERIQISSPEFGSSIALDAAGNPHVAYSYYYYGPNYEPWRKLVYAHRDNGMWTTEVVDATTILVGENCSLALDAQGNPRISYYTSTLLDLRYAWKNEGQWFIETADDGFPNDVGAYTSLALDHLGNPHIAYLDATQGRLKHSYREGYSWVRETIADAPAMVIPFPSLEVDAVGTPRIGYFDWADQVVRYACKYGSEWIVQPVDTIEGNGLGYVSLELDKSGNPHLAYLADEDPMYAVGSTATTVPLTPIRGRMTVFPNPTRAGHVVLSYATPISGNAQVRIFDLTGRLVANVVSNRRLAESGQLSWDGRDDMGREVPSGQYFVTLRVGSSESQARLSVIR